jgi:hypothetical protein
MIFPLAVSCWLLGGISPTAVDSAVDFPGRVCALAWRHFPARRAAKE